MLQTAYSAMFPCADTDKKREQRESRWLAEHFPKTEDALLVKKHIFASFGDRYVLLLWKGREQELLELARELEREEQEEKK